MKISIIIPTWNTALITVRCIKTIIHHLPSKMVEVIVVDNYSQDNTLSLLSSFPSIKIIKNTSNLGYATACNQGAKIASGDFLFFLNSDIRLLDSSIIDMAQYLAKHYQVGAIGPKFLNPDLSPQASVFPPQTILNAVKEYWLGISHAYSKYLINTHSPVSVNSISGGAILLSASYFNQLGGWNEIYHFYYEDLDLCRRIISNHKLIIYYPKCRLIHDHGVSGSGLTSADNQWRRLIPGSLIYHGKLKHYIINFILWSGQKFRQLF